MPNKIADQTRRVAEALAFEVYDPIVKASAGLEARHADPALNETEAKRAMGLILERARKKDVMCADAVDDLADIKTALQASPKAPKTPTTPAPKQPGKAKKVLTTIGKGIAAVIAAAAVGGGIGVTATYAIEAYSKPAPYVLVRPKGELFYIESKVNGEWKAAKDVKETDIVAESRIAIPTGQNKYMVFPIQSYADRNLVTYIRKAQEDARKKGTLASKGVYFSPAEIEQLIYQKILNVTPGQARTITFAQCQLALDELAKQS